jgi:hypothetical protein
MGLGEHLTTQLTAVLVTTAEKAKTLAGEKVVETAPSGDA